MTLAHPAGRILTALGPLMGAVVHYLRVGGAGMLAAAFAMAFLEAFSR
jgi:hypothetical protein